MITERVQLPINQQTWFHCGQWSKWSLKGSVKLQLFTNFVRINRRKFPVLHKSRRWHTVWAFVFTLRTDKWQIRRRTSCVVLAHWSSTEPGSWAIRAGSYRGMNRMEVRGLNQRRAQTPASKWKGVEVKRAAVRIKTFFRAQLYPTNAELRSGFWQSPWSLPVTWTTVARKIIFLCWWNILSSVAQCTSVCPKVWPPQISVVCQTTVVGHVTSVRTPRAGLAKGDTPTHQCFGLFSEIYRVVTSHKTNKKPKVRRDKTWFERTTVIFIWSFQWEQLHLQPARAASQPLYCAHDQKLKTNGLKNFCSGLNVHWFGKTKLSCIWYSCNTLTILLLMHNLRWNLFIP